ncbi:MAG TPA: methionine--tRNA ligase [Actinomycetota bacterium]|nr:methionine--tRNA ligase [Actinomycetota bacterium]
MSTFYVTTAIPYVNSDPHIGFALEALIADAIARYRRKQGDAVRSLTGTDDNSIKSVQAAEREGVPVVELVARYADSFYRLGDALDLSVDDFIRTSSDARHRAGVNKLWSACDAAGDIYKGHYRGRYCSGCERFLDDSDLTGGRCSAHETVPEEVEEENWFFRLSRYTEQLLQLVTSRDIQILPESRRNEVLSLLRSGLRDFSISRSAERARGWGLPVPRDPTQVMYVWFDALGNYITALDYATDGPAFQQYWLQSPHRVHIIGKDIIRFHAVYWPAMLLSAGIPLPTAIVTHGFVTIDGRKISKSLGNVIDPFALVDEFGVDTVRYFLLRHIRTTEDGDFTRDRFVLSRNADLSDQLGNLVSRVVAMVHRYLDGRVPTARGGPLTGQARELPSAVEVAMKRFAIHDAIGAIWGLVEAANRYVVETAPWVLAREADGRLEDVLAELCAVIRTVGDCLEPFLPRTSSEILARVGVPGNRVRTGPPLFPKT